MKTGPGYRRWSINPLGNPVSQFCGVLQGRSDMFSDSVLAHPQEHSATRPSNNSNTQRGLEIRILTKQDGPE